MPFAQRKIYSLHEARVKIRRYCAYQERSQQEVKQRLLSYGLLPYIADELLIELIQEDFLNEERFAETFARGKVNVKAWGPVKIVSALRQKDVSEPNIKKAMAAIEPDKLLANLEYLTRKRWESLKGENHVSRKQKTINYLISKGYYFEDIASMLKRITND